MVLPVLTAEGRSYPDGKVPSPSRDYTPRWWDHEAGELAIDFVLHDRAWPGRGPSAHSPATRW